MEKRKSGKLLAISWYQTLLVPKNCFINQCLQSVINSNIEVFFKAKIDTLLAEFPDIDIAAMGFPRGWESEPLWK